MNVRLKMDGYEEAVIVQNVELVDGLATVVAHGLGQVPRFVGPSATRGPVSSGHIEEVRPARLDRSNHVVLKASGYGVTIEIDLLVVP